MKNKQNAKCFSANRRSLDVHVAGARTEGQDTILLRDFLKKKNTGSFELELNKCF